MLFQMVRKVSAHFLFVTLLTTGLLLAPSAASGQSNDGKKLDTKEDPAMIGQRNINGGWDKITGWFGGSRQKEIEIGRQLSLQVEQQAKMVEDPMITEYINRVGQNIVLNSDAKIPFTIKVIDSDEVNAFALPGGYFFVNKGLIVAAENEAELAGVMAHEVAHVAARHAMENAGKGALLNYGLIAGIIFSGGITSAILQNTAGIGQALAFFKFSRGAEKEADILGVQYLYAAGYDPTGMATMFEKLASRNKKKPGTLSKLFSSHPQSIERRDASLELVSRFPEKAEYVISTSEFQKVRAHLLRITNAVSITPDDIDDGGGGRPTLKRRDPVPDTTEEPGKSAKPEETGPPKLKRRNEPTPPSDDPDNDN
ncbi:MAG: M48 family metallopeptidase [Acidobacteriota bacterium]|nr:M48 family metallopeptidase [Acidobacteriota bacterium]MDH3528865.1 M48 family metallopeptidase [Acidobacteriota bacterium]